MYVYGSNVDSHIEHMYKLFNIISVNEIYFNKLSLKDVDDEKIIPVVNHRDKNNWWDDEYSTNR